MSKPEAAFVFSGGGALGLAHLGAWEILANHFDVRAVAGTSAGAIVAAFCGLGYPPSYAISHFKPLDLQEMTGISASMAGLLGLRGRSDGVKFTEWMLDKLQPNFPLLSSQRIKFGNVYQIDRPIELIIVAADLNNPTTPVILSRETEPDTVVAEAVRMSMSVPFLFAPVKRKDKRQVLVDGGLLLNFPTELLLPLVKKLGIPLIGIHFKRQEHFLEDPRLLDIKEYANALLGSLMSRSNALPKDVIAYERYIDIEIDSGKADWLDFSMSRDDKDTLIRQGRLAAELAIEKYKNQNPKLALSNDAPIVAVEQPVTTVSLVPSTPSTLRQRRVETLHKRIQRYYPGDAIRSFCLSYFPRAFENLIIQNLNADVVIDELIKFAQKENSLEDLLDYLEEDQNGIIGTDREALIRMYGRS